ncbi:MAG: DedA family protein, partial [Planctomycetes bacterium]|nr:DedA family protein [Planctomycetota bacterium]
MNNEETGDRRQETGETPSRNPLRRMYRWVLSWAESRYGEAALCGVSFVESSCFPIPPDALLIPLVLGKPSRAVRLATLCTIASTLGGLAGYGIGHFLWHTGGEYSPLARWCFGHLAWLGLTLEGFETMQVRYEAWNFWIVFVAAFTPIPYKLITISAGAFGVALVPFTIASIAGRGTRF